MGDIIFKIWYMIAVLPFLIIVNGYPKLKKFMHDQGWYWELPHFLLAVLIIILVVLLASGYR